jgi:hypothetical protein
MPENSQTEGASRGLWSDGFKLFNPRKHVIAVLAAVATTVVGDVLKPLLQLFTLELFVTAAFGAGIILLLARLRILKPKIWATFFVFFAVTTLLSTAVYISGLLQTRQAPHPTAIAQHIAGTWGEGDCATASYRFQRVQNALIVESGKRPAGAQPYRFEGTIINESDTAMDVRGEKPESAKGLAATFHYESNGTTERLHWQDRVSGGTDVELNRCE